jgi:hypothetical protein
MRPSLAIALAIPALLAACDTCGPPERCFYATLLLQVHDVETGAPLPEATIAQAGVALQDDLPAAACAGGQCTHAVSPATGRVTISLAGYQDAFVDFVERSDTCGAPTRQFADVGMRALSDPGAGALVTGPADRGSGCN